MNSVKLVIGLMNDVDVAGISENTNDYCKPNIVDISGAILS